MAATVSSSLFHSFSLPNEPRHVFSHPPPEGEHSRACFMGTHRERERRCKGQDEIILIACSRLFLNYICVMQSMMGRKTWDNFGLTIGLWLEKFFAEFVARVGSYERKRPSTGLSQVWNSYPFQFHCECQNSPEDHQNFTHNFVWTLRKRRKIMNNNNNNLQHSIVICPPTFCNL